MNKQFLIILKKTTSFFSILSLVIIFFCFFNQASAQLDTNDFVTTWKTNNQGASNDSSIFIATDTNFTYNYDVDWDNDGIFDTIGVTSNITHQFNDTGIYTIRIRGTFPSIKFGFHDGALNFTPYNAKNKIIYVEQWGNQPWKDLRSAFSYCLNLKFRANDVPILDSLNSLKMFLSGATKFNSNINNWDVSSITDMNMMFFKASSFNQALNAWDVSNVTEMKQMFSYCHSFNQALNNWDVSSVESMERMFEYSSVFNQSLDNWNVSSVTSMKLMFYEDTAFNQPLNSWDVSNVINMNGMFINASSFNQPINSWDVSSVNDMGGMFSGASDFNQPLDSFDVSNVTNMSYLFSNSSFNQSINNWDVSNVNSMDGMFNNLSSFNHSLNNWDVSNVGGMWGMFSGASSFNQALNNWDVSSVYRMRNMFSGATNFNQDLSAWDVSNVADMYSMFKNAISFNQNLGDWQTSANRSYMLDSTALSTSNYDSTIISWKSQSPNQGIDFGAGGLEYCLAKQARDSLIRYYGWNFAGDSKDASCFVTTINENANDSTNLFKIYPNPTMGILSLEIENIEPNQPLFIYNQMGQLVREQKVIQGKNQLDLSDQAKGIYIVRYGQFSKKIVLVE